MAITDNGTAMAVDGLLRWLFPQLSNHWQEPVDRASAIDDAARLADAGSKHMMAGATGEAVRRAAATSGLVVTHWISVEDRLPTEDDYGEDDDVLVRYRYTDAPGRPWCVGLSFHDPRDPENGGWAFGSCDYAEVSHWMPCRALLEAVAEVGRP